GVLPPKEKPKDEIEETVLHLQKEAEGKYYFKMHFKCSKDAYCYSYLLIRRQKYGKLREICGEQDVKEVTNAPEDVWVIIHLYQSSIPVCLLVNEHLSLLAKNFPEVKFLKAIVNSCILNYHDRCLPTILVYKTGEIKGRFVGVAEWGGIYLKVEELEWKLAEVGAIESNLEENPKKDIMNMIALSVQNMKTQIQRAVM
uniref:Phosducin like 2 n=1 Tax=Bubo bubo TaxID=30461 RepID=A0A8C0ESD2_BUBBB